MSAIHVICFSKDRPLQLHGYLTSLFAQWHGDVQVSVLARLEQPYAAAYFEVFDEFAGRAIFTQEMNFAGDLRGVVNGHDAPFTCFGVDDAVFVQPVPVERVCDSLSGSEEPLGYSLRLGRNIRRNFLVGEIPQPDFLGPYHATSLVWDASAPTSRSDWGYPWEVMGTVYRTEFVREMVAALTKAGQCNSPSQLEHYGSLCWMAHTPHRLLAAPWQSALVLPVVNRVQDEFPNPGLGGPDLSPEFLLTCWEAGLRLDTERFGQRVYDAMHIPDFFLRRAV